MFLKILMGILAAAIIASQVFAAPLRPIEKFVDKISHDTGMSETDVREKAVEALRRSGRYSREELERVRSPEGEHFSPVKENEMVRLLQNSRGFRLATGIEAIRVNSIASEAEEAFMNNAREESLEEFKTTTQSAGIVRITAQAIGMKLSMLKLKHPERTKEIEATTKEFNAAVKAMDTASEDVLYVLTILLGTNRIPYAKTQDPHVLTIDLSAADAKFNEAVKAIIPQLKSRSWFPSADPTIAIDVYNLANDNNYDSVTNTVYLGSDFLRRVTEVGN